MFTIASLISHVITKKAFLPCVLSAAMGGPGGPGFPPASNQPDLLSSGQGGPGGFRANTDGKPGGLPSAGY